MTIIRNENIVIYPSPEELADEFTNMDDSNQVRFLNTVASASERYGFLGCFQFQYITDHPDLTPEARAWMRQLGEYADPREKPIMKFKRYFIRDPKALEPYFSEHMMAMTAESLHEKGDIACELAFRDKQIAELKEFLQHWISDGHFQTFEDRERFRVEAYKLL